MSESATQKTDLQKTYIGPLIIIGILFFIFGFITWVNSVLIAFFQKAFQLTDIESYLVTFAFFISYTLMAIPGSWVLKKTGFKNGMSLGLGTMAIGTAIFIPAAKMGSYPVFLFGLFIIGIGLTILQTASNPYVTILGPRESAAQRISFLGIMNKIAGILSQFILGSVLLSKTAAGDSALDKVIMPYSILTGSLIVLALLIRFSHLPEANEEQDNIDETGVPKDSIFKFPNLVLGVAALFAYVGVEVIAGDTIILYGKSMGFQEETAKLFTNITLISMLSGYVIGIFLIPKYVSQQKFLRISAISGVIFALNALFTTGIVSVVSIGLLGLSNAIMWPAIWPLAINGLGKFTKIGSALLIMGIAGGAVIPLIYGAIADQTSRHTAYWITIPCYLYVLYYAISGHKKTNW